MPAPPPTLNRDMSAEAERRHEAVITVPPDPANSALNALIVSCTFLVMSMHAFVIISSETKHNVNELVSPAMISLLANIRLLCADETQHLLTCIGSCEHNPPLADWYRFYVITMQSMRLPAFYFLQNELLAPLIGAALDDKTSPMGKIVCAQAIYLFLLVLSYAYSECVNPSYIINERQRNLFFKWGAGAVPESPKPSPSPEQSPAAITPPLTPVKRLLSRFIDG